MGHAVELTLSSGEKVLLSAITRSGKSPQREVERAKVVLPGAAGHPNGKIGAALGVTRQKAARWRECFAAQRLEGFSADRSGRGRKPVITPAQRPAVVEKTTRETPPGQTPRSVRPMAKATGPGAPRHPGNPARPWTQTPPRPHVQSVP